MTTTAAVDLYRQAGIHAAKIMTGVRSEHLTGPTPCAKWTVQDVVDHLVGGTGYLLAAATGGQPGEPPVRAGTDRFATGVATVLDAVAQPGVTERRCMSPLGFEWSVGEALAGTFMDVLVHSWDLATATGQDTHLDPDLVRACWDMFIPEMPERGRRAGLIGPQVAVPSEAPLQDRLLGAMGRQP
ncbi:TIGR03086 family metal-binding protein [Parafrankia sp. BMG5.11]|uniref:TIGR03086 family metal-binding protein n=1 Tax=Parafrankia sp. BMG5.11 TaxID=222540 RepID=UPI001040AAD8|nr:TIGR03086 family metal-binding protein [Parafrankia sp. BMG5.11]TCJ31768.1 TIGR03086 family protein [Parafrankia sp. BMG5.11]CAI7973762.1 TIGR03086 family protein [Frankia sp. Hr75.2]